WSGYPPGPPTLPEWRQAPLPPVCSIEQTGVNYPPKQPAPTVRAARAFPSERDSSCSSIVFSVNGVFPVFLFSAGDTWMKHLRFKVLFVLAAGALVGERIDNQIRVVTPSIPSHRH